MFIALLTFCLLLASSSVGALDKRSGDEHHVIESFSTDPEEDEIILNKENLRPEYSQTEDTAIDDDFRLQRAMFNLREKKNECPIKVGEKKYGTMHWCDTGCICKKCALCVREGKQ